MPAREPFDASLYARMFPLDVPSTAALVIRLMGLVPRSKNARDKDELARIRPAATALRASGVTLQDTWRIREETGMTKLRPIDIEWDAAWSALLSRLEPWSIFARLEHGAEDAARAQALVSLLFANRLDFTRLELNAQWVEGKRRLDWIEQKKLRGDLVDLAGESFMGRVEETHGMLGRALGLLGEPPDPDLPLVVDLAGAKRAAHSAVVAYALQLMAADATATDALSEQIRGSLAAIDQFRARARPSTGGTDAGAAGTADIGTDTEDTDAPEPVVDPNTVDPNTVDPNTVIPPLPPE